MTDCKIKKKLALQAIKAVKLLVRKHLDDPSKKKLLLEDETDSALFLQINLKKIPALQHYQMIKVSLPHSLINDSTNVCLITGDLDKRNHKAEIDPVILHYKEILEKNGVTKITQVIPLRELRTEYKSYESKRQLLGAHDVFLADNVIAGCLPRLLGKLFFKKRKFPIQINMKKNLKKQIEKAISQTVFFVSSRGNSCTSEVARLHMSDKEILENVIASVNILCDKLPGGFDNILGMHIKTAKSKAIPIYISFGNPNDVVLKPIRHKENVEAEELSTLPDVNVRVFRDGRVEIEKVVETCEEISTEHEKKNKPEPFKIKSESSLSNNEKINDSHGKEELDIKDNIVLDEKYSPPSERMQKRRRNSSQDADESKNCVKASVVLLHDEHNGNKLLSSKKQSSESKINVNENNEICSAEEVNKSGSHEIQSNEVLTEETDKMNSAKKLEKKLSKKKHMLHDKPGGEIITAKSGRKVQVHANSLNHKETKVQKVENILSNDSIKVQRRRKRFGIS